ncbi:hypothetical protein OESDEN_04275 [Oesophagostomum dentatum]|uniref:Uncharacterized protein n=1 Tax=Oesophagostomum dentatum TaxID=61180 RepID=A0A0B1TI58_OESDE|nr:hypothetical protein OESDEN_04275 [Oesophagostomum dentatum]
MELSDAVHYYSCHVVACLRAASSLCYVVHRASTGKEQSSNRSCWGDTQISKYSKIVDELLWNRTTEWKIKAAISLQEDKIY